MATKKAAKKGGKAKAIPVVTPWFTARYPKISKPDTEGQYADGKFKTDGVPLEDSDLEAFETKLLEAAKQFWPDVAEDEISLPVKDFYKNKEAKEAGEVEARGFTLKSKYRPACFDAKKKKLPEGVAIGGGSVIRVASSIFPWSKTSKMKVKDAKGKVSVEETTEYGVGLRLGDVQVRELMQGGGSGDGSAFDEVEDGFEYEGADTGGDQFDNDDDTGL